MKPKKTTPKKRESLTIFPLRPRSFYRLYFLEVRTHDLVQDLSIETRRAKDGCPCRLLKLRQTRTQIVQMKEFLPWLVRWAFNANTRYFLPAFAALNGAVQNVFSSPYSISIHLFLSPSMLGRQSCRVACLLVFVSDRDSLFL